MPDTILVGTRKGLFTITEGTLGYEIADLAFPAVPVVAVLADRRDGAWYVGVQHGHFGPKAHRSLDQGATWAEIGAPTYPAKPEGEPDQMEPMGRRTIPWSVELLWTLEAGHPDRPGELWCGTIPGGLFHSTDRGANWSLVRPLWDHPHRPKWFGGGYDLPGIHSLSIDPRRPDALLAGVSCGGAWHSDDGGKSWEVRADGMQAHYLPPELAGDPWTQDPHRIVRCGAEPDVLWTQHHCGIFRTVDNARHWTEITEAGPSTFGFAVAVHPADPDTAWFVPAQADEMRIPVGGEMVVTRTRDGGRSFEVLRDGLPQRHAYHLVYRHGLDVDRTGQRLVLGSTTGSLWTSDDAGDGFSHLTSSLPPINAVRFV
jgi:hypothetical protein